MPSKKEGQSYFRHFPKQRIFCFCPTVINKSFYFVPTMAEIINKTWKTSHWTGPVLADQHGTHPPYSFGWKGYNYNLTSYL